MHFRTTMRMLAATVAVTLTATAFAAEPAQAAVPADWLPEAQTVVEWTNVNQLQEVFSRSGNGSVRHTYQTHISGPVFDGTLGGIIKGSPSVTFNAYDQTHVYVRGDDDQIWVRWQAYPGSTDAWNNSWVKMFTVPGKATSNPSAVRDERSLMELFVRGGNNAIYTIWQSNATSGNWVTHAADGQWTSIHGNCESSPKAVLVGSQMKVFCYGRDGERYVNIRANAHGADFTGWVKG
jgi:hypothetical protein